MWPSGSAALLNGVFRLLAASGAASRGSAGLGFFFAGPAAATAAETSAKNGDDSDDVLGELLLGGVNVV